VRTRTSEFTLSHWMPVLSTKMQIGDDKQRKRKILPALSE